MWARRMRRSRAALFFVCCAQPLVLAAPLPAAPPSTARHAGLCDASAAVALDRDRFVVADDERNTLAVFRLGTAEAIERIDLSRHLNTKADKESDIEGAARVGQRIFWVTSHGRNAKGEEQKRRQRFFATDIAQSGQPSLVPAGAAYTKLLADLQRAPAFAAFALEKASRLAPEAAGGLNIEGLAATPNGALLIGFRSPLRASRALLVLLLNPGDLLQGKPARFGAPVELDLGGRGIRSIERVGTGYLIVAGPTADNGSFALFEWSGRSSDRPVAVVTPDLADEHPEALFAAANSAQVYSLSDDGGRMIGASRCKDLPAAAQLFRARRVR